MLGLLVVACGRPPVIPVYGDYKIQIGSPPALLLAQLEPVPRGNAARQSRLLEIFAEAGCEQLEERAGGESELPHVVCILPGSGEGRILVSANFDAPIRRSSHDNWTGAAMLPSLYRSLRVAERRHTYEFVGFADERPGQGSPADSFRVLERLPDEERGRIDALVGLQGLRIDLPAVWEVRADPNLRLDLYSVSRSLDLPMRHVDFVVRPGSGRRLQDSTRLRGPDTQVPSILIAVADHHVGEYLDSFRLVAAYLSYLDQTIDLRRRMRERIEPEEPPASG